MTAPTRILLALLLGAAAAISDGDGLLRLDRRHDPPANDGSRATAAASSADKDGAVVSQVRKFAADEGDPRVLNVHVVPHTHDDVGWLKTVDQYYQGLNGTIQQANVRSILTTVVESLLAHPSRTFTYVEQKFFSLWWGEQPDAVRDRVRDLVANGQLAFANGGWCMHDEASAHYVSMIDQTSLGHAFLRRELGCTPRVAWQLDPFGHSATQASLMTSRMGMDAVFFGRIDYQDLDLRRLTRECEGLWNASGSLPDTAVFWGLTGSYRGNYGPPPGFWYDVNTGEPSLVGADPEVVRGKIRTLLEYLRLQSDQTRGNHVMLTMGSDFQFERAEYNFANYDILVGNTMAYQALGTVDVPSIIPRYDRVNIFYSNPEYYTDCKYRETRRSSAAAGRAKAAAEAAPGGGADSSASGLSPSPPVEWSVKRDDFFPYSDSPHSFWTGYFTSRTSFKRLERVASGFLLAARQVLALPLPSPDGDDDPEGEGGFSRMELAPYYDLEDALGVAQHHDAVSGTAKQHVADDYSKRLQHGLDRSARYVAAKLRRVMLNGPGHDIADLADLAYCPLLNESICEVSERATRQDDTALYVIAYNPLATERSTAVRLPVSSRSAFEVTRMDGGKLHGMPSLRTVPILESSSTCPTCRKKRVLVFDTGTLPPLGAVAYRIAKVASPLVEAEAASTTRILVDTTPTSLHVSNGLVSAYFDSSTGKMSAVSSDGRSVTVESGYYKSYDTAFDKSEVDDSGQRSGAYIFRPSEPEEALTLFRSVRSRIVNTSVGLEVHAEFEEPWVKQVARFLTGQPYMELEYTVGPVPIDDGRGKEIVMRYSADIASEGTFFTDSNGREFQRRQRNQRPTWDLSVYEPVAGNYYPVNSAMYLEDGRSALAVLVDRSQGGASLADGSLELMVQRRILADDGRGVDEALNETVGGTAPYPPYGDRRRLGEGVVVRGTHRIFFSSLRRGAQLCRSAMDGVFAQPVVLFGSAPANRSIAFRKPSFSAIRQSLPSNIMLITFARLPGSGMPTYLIRLAHQYGVGEDETLSQPVAVDLSSLFTQGTIVKVTEKTLSGNLDWEDYLQARKRWTDEEEIPYDGVNSTVVMTPMNIRTFEVAVQAATETTTG